ncbi:MAG: hypothetical protein PHR14_09710 [Oscillospiraceae bacterium]|nr:hypothetical protein [Oscillospiraceae bacterium]
MVERLVRERDIDYSFAKTGKPEMPLYHATIRYFSKSKTLSKIALDHSFDHRQKEN